MTAAFSFGTNSVASRVSEENSSSTTSSGGVIHFPGAHPSSEGKRRRNRSNVEAMTAKNLQDDVDKEDLSATTVGTSPETPSGGSTSTTKSAGSGQAADSGHPDSPDVTDIPISSKDNIAPIDSNT